MLSYISLNFNEIRAFLGESAVYSIYGSCIGRIDR